MRSIYLTAAVLLALNAPAFAADEAAAQDAAPPEVQSPEAQPPETLQPETQPPEVLPPETPLPAPPPAATIEPRSFTIFFEHSAPQIPEEAEALLPQIAEIFSRVGYQAVAVSCHSDNVASQAINIPLTEDRARRIKTELVRYGVPEAIITAVGLGFSEPLVQDTAPETAVSNRRCVITLS